MSNSDEAPTMAAAPAPVPAAESDSGSITEKNRLTVSGRLLGFNGGILFFTFDGGDDNSAPHVCLFRAHRIFFDQKRVQPHEVKNKQRVEALVKARLEGQVLNAHVEPMEKEDALYRTAEGEEVRPRWYSHCVWLGTEPTEEQRAPSAIQKALQAERAKASSTSMNEDAGREVHECPGHVVYQSSSSGLGIISFQLDGKENFAQFAMKQLYVDGKSVELLSWKPDMFVSVCFNAHSSSNLSAIHRKLRDADEDDLVYAPTWRCTIVWSGNKPSVDVFQMLSQKQRRKWRSGDNNVDNTEDICGRLTHFVDRATGVIQGRNVAALFKLQDLVLDGIPADQSSRLSSLCQVGDVLFANVRPLVPARSIGDIVCNRIAIEIWKGKKTRKQDLPADQADKVTTTTTAENDETSASSALLPVGGSKKRVYPMPSAATHFNQEGYLSDVQNVVGTITLASNDPNLSGQRVLLSKNRLFVNGQRIRFKEFLTQSVRPGDKLFFDMVSADREEAQGEYEWLALLAWQTDRPTAEEVATELGTSGKAIWRAKLLKFDARDPFEGFCSGVLQIVSGPSNLGERVIFHRDHTYVFGARMARADLYYVMKENDKVQLDFDALDSDEMLALEQKYGCEIKYRANMVWIGPMPRLEEDCDRFPDYMGGVVLPFLQKRQMDEELFTKLIMGKMKPKEYSPSLVERHKDKLPPNQILAKVTELKRPDPATSRGTTHGIMTIENGPMTGQKTFFARSHITIFGYNMSKADLMYVIKETDRFLVEVRTGTNNKLVPNVLVSAWIGQQPSDKNKAVPADTSNAAFKAWLEDHNFVDFNQFKECVAGELPPRPFHPLPLEVQIGRITYLYPHYKTSIGTGTEAGIIRIHQGNMSKRDVLFERENIFIWGINLKAGDVGHVLKEGDKVMLEAIEISGKERKKRQAKLGTTNIPKYVATLVYIGGGRPKLQDSEKNYSLEELEKNQNIKQWLNKRGKSVKFFWELISGNLPPKSLPQQAKPSPSLSSHAAAFPSSYCQQPLNISHAFTPPYMTPRRGSAEGHPHHGSAVPALNYANNGVAFHREFLYRHPPPNATATNHQDLWKEPPVAFNKSPPPEPVSESSGEMINNPVLTQAQLILKRVMACTSPDDVRVETIIEDYNQAQLGLFIAKTLEAGVRKYHLSKESRARQQQHLHDPGPIAPPSKSDLTPAASNARYFLDSAGSAENARLNLIERSSSLGFSAASTRTLLSPDVGFEKNCASRAEALLKSLESDESHKDVHFSSHTNGPRQLGGLLGLQASFKDLDNILDIDGQKSSSTAVLGQNGASYNPWDTTNITRPQGRGDPSSIDLGSLNLNSEHSSLGHFLPK